MRSYPFVGRGWTNNGDQMTSLSTPGTYDWTTTAGLGLPIASITHARVHWAFRAPTTGSPPPRWMALEDIYFHREPTPSYTAFPPHTDLMINTALADQAVGSTGFYAYVAEAAHAQSVTIGGLDWLVMIDEPGEAGFHDGGHNIHLFLEPTDGLLWGSMETTVDLAAIIQYFRRSDLDLVDASGATVTGSLLDDGLYLTAINAGFEVNVGVPSFDTTEFWVALGDEPDGPS